MKNRSQCDLPPLSPEDLKDPQVVADLEDHLIGIFANMPCDLSFDEAVEEEED